MCNRIAYLKHTPKSMLLIQQALRDDFIAVISLGSNIIQIVHRIFYRVLLSTFSMPKLYLSFESFCILIAKINFLNFIKILETSKHRFFYKGKVIIIFNTIKLTVKFIVRIELLQTKRKNAWVDNVTQMLGLLFQCSTV